MLWLSSISNSNSNSITTGERIYLGSFFVVLITAAGPMLTNPITYNDTMNNFGRILGDDSAESYSVDSMPDRLRYKLLQDVSAMACGILSATIGGWGGLGPILVTLTSFDLLGALTSFWSLQKYRLKGEWMPIMAHGIFGLWGLGLCWNYSQRMGTGGGQK